MNENLAEWDMKDEIYLDNAATTPVDPVVKKEMDKYFCEDYGNPGSFNSIGLRIRLTVDEARQKIADILNCTVREVVFTSGGTESINLALQGVARANKDNGKHIITTNAEHHAVLHTLEYLEKNEGFEITYLEVDKYGLVSVDDVKKALRDDTILVSIIYASNEIGSINPISEIGEFLKEKDVYFHTDACQAVCLLDIDVKNLNVDLMTLNGGKIYGPKGVGMLYVKSGTSIHAILHGGGQEWRLRSGTENVPGIVGFVKALEICQETKNEEYGRLAKLRLYFKKELEEKITKLHFNGHPTNCLPSNLNVSILDIEGEALMLHINEYGICTSSGSACTSLTLDPSHVIIATKLPYEVAHGSLRFSMGRYTSKEEIDKVMEVLPKIVKELRLLSPVNLDKNIVLEGVQNG
jgi:cysteine desulfurase